MEFRLGEKELEKYLEWSKEHDKGCRCYKNSGAIGGRLTFSFTPTSLGMITKVSCSCGGL